jgi:competence protein ComEA
MILLEKHLKGIIAICIVLAIIPLVAFLSGSKTKYRIPELADQFTRNAVEIVQDGKSWGIYFVTSGTSVNQLFLSIGIQPPDIGELILRNGTRITIDSSSENKLFTVAEMQLAKRLALGMPIDVNQALESDLLLINGIGPVTAENIICLRSKLGRYENIEQLTQIRGIKDKKLAKLRKYLYVEK